MKTSAITPCAALGLIFWVLFPAAGAQLEIVTNAAPQRIFFGGPKNISVTFLNPSDQGFQSEVRTRLLQTSSATVVQLAEMSWKKLQVLPQQTVIESAQFDFPAVKAETKFLVQWVAASSGAGFQPASSSGAANRSSNEQAGKMPAPLLGITEVLVYPTNLLAELKVLAGDEPVGMFDPQNQLKPLLKNLRIEFADLEDTGLDHFQGKLAIIGPFLSKSQMREGLAEQIQVLAKKNTAVVWIQPDLSPRPSPLRGAREKLQPSFYSVPEGQVAIVVVQPYLVADLPQNPQSQLNLIYFCKLALQPETPHLPNPTDQP